MIQAENAENGKQEDDIDPDLCDEDGNFDEISANAKAMRSFKLKEQSLRCPELEDNPVFKRLRHRLIKYYLEAEHYRKLGPNAKQIELKARLGIDWSYTERLFHCLKVMLREVINTEDKANQTHYLKKTYEWFLKQQIAVGLVDPDEQAKENDFMNPKMVEAKKQALREKEDAGRMNLLDEVKH